jgi:hypothetical protein
MRRNRLYCADGSLSEHGEQVVFVDWAIDNKKKKTEGWIPKEQQLLFYAIPNGARVSIGTAVKLKAEGLRKGAPDIIFDWPRLGYHGLRIEMKRKEGGVISPEQRAIHDALRKAGYSVHVCKGANDAERIMRWYMLSISPIDVSENKL